VRVEVAKGRGCCKRVKREFLPINRKPAIREGQNHELPTKKCCSFRKKKGVSEGKRKENSLWERKGERRAHTTQAEEKTRYTSVNRSENACGADQEYPGKKNLLTGAVGGKRN